MDGAQFGIALSEQIRAFIEERFPLVASAGMSTEASLLDSGAIDSLGLLDIVSFLEDDLGVAIDDDDMAPENFDSIAVLTRFVELKRG